MLTAPRLTCDLFVLLLTRLMSQRIVSLAGVSRVCHLSSSVTLPGARAVGRPTLHGGPVELGYVRPVRTTPCSCIVWQHIQLICLHASISRL